MPSARRRSLLFVALLLPAADLASHAQSVDDQARGRAHVILAQVRKDLEQYYYDSTFGGVDLGTRFQIADSTLDQNSTVQELFGTIAQFVLDLKDSHTNFIPPARAATVNYGWTWSIVGNDCYVNWIRKDSDAEKKGLAVGDRILALDGMLLNRQTSHLIRYLYSSLNPRPGMHLVIQKPDSTQQTFDVLAKVTPGQRVFDYTSFTDVGRLIDEIETSASARRHWWRSFGDSVLVWHFLQFVGGDEGIDEMMDRARKHRTLIMDLRNNGGGSENAILQLIGHFYDHDVRIATTRERGVTRPLTARAKNKHPFTGNLIILINSRSASASEITTRFLQLEGRATVVGDHSAGAVMGAIGLSHAAGFSKFLEYGLQVTVEDLVMPDEGRLENVGVMPEFIVIPTGADLAAHRDPQMSKALALAGIQMDPVAAAKIYEGGNR